MISITKEHEQYMRPLIEVAKIAEKKGDFLCYVPYRVMQDV